MLCPTCGKNVTFPALPPGGRKKVPLRIKRDVLVPTRWPVKLPAFVLQLLAFQHWNVVGACVLPFVVLGGLWIGASVVRKKFGDAPAMPTVGKVRADPHAWQQATNLARAEQS